MSRTSGSNSPRYQEEPPKTPQAPDWPDLAAKVVLCSPFVGFILVILGLAFMWLPLAIAGLVIAGLGVLALCAFAAWAVS